MAINLLLRVVLNETHHETGKTKHYAGSSVLPKPSELRIIRFDADPEVYLLYVNADGEEMTDTLHDSVSDAVEQAEREFMVKPTEWENLAELDGGSVM